MNGIRSLRSGTGATRRLEGGLSSIDEASSGHSTRLNGRNATSGLGIMSLCRCRRVSRANGDPRAGRRRRPRAAAEGVQRVNDERLTGRIHFNSESRLIWLENESMWDIR